LIRAEILKALVQVKPGLIVYLFLSAQD